MRTDSFFVPYTGKKPASVSVNGHRLVILASERGAIEDDLDLLGADRIKKVRLGSSDEEQERTLGKIARQADGGVVIAPAGVGIRDILKNLESELPWVH
jgi:hypothetical protein